MEKKTVKTEKTVKTLSEIVADSLFNHCCKGKKCDNCKYNTPHLFCHIAKIIKIVKDYEEVNLNEKNNKNQ